MANAPPAIVALFMVGSPEKTRVSCRARPACLAHGAARDYLDVPRANASGRD